MHSVCFKIGEFPIHWFGVMMALGFLSALASWTLLGKKEGRDFNYCSDMLFWIMVAGIIGARAAYVISDFRTFMERPVTILYVHRGGLIYYGGFIGAGLALYFFSKFRREKFMSVVDFVMTSVPLGHVFGRIGCFMNGCCYGSEYSGLLSVTYPRASLPWDNQLYAGKIAADAKCSLAVYPVQLYEALFNLLLYFLLVWAYRNRKVDGRITALYLITYPVGRFLLEFYRGDERMRWCMGLSVAQIISIGLFALGLAIWFLSRREKDSVPANRS
ncbi:MAG: prolipoprotein diacylglyceryl transferase [Kiritimatiellae bacterium]|nr:prolipoprotein diacylglyceryl transferase [Kiritimatiellia bacterium]MDD5520043.1 prolipoprotein diacylglyceryl transferase [Kiritimatiellia bacterium]